MQCRRIEMLLLLTIMRFYCQVFKFSALNYRQFEVAFYESNFLSPVPLVQKSFHTSFSGLKSTPDRIRQ